MHQRDSRLARMDAQNCASSKAERHHGCIEECRARDLQEGKRVAVMRGGSSSDRRPRKVGFLSLISNHYELDSKQRVRMTSLALSIPVATTSVGNAPQRGNAEAQE